MFDNKEIARRAICRSEEIKLQRRKRLVLYQSLSASLVTVMSLSAIIVFQGIVNKNDDTDYISIEDAQVPLSAIVFMQENEDFNFPLECYKSVTVYADEPEAWFNVPLQNPKNSGFYVRFELRLKDTDEELYVSDFIAPTENVGKFMLLSTPLEGEYKAVLTVHVYEKEGSDFKSRNSVSTELDLIIS
ncbi:MAG: hypothetical protein FWG70_05680 [Oscillospiraceae bacterium]|nr:hypothetical protein [Oscillospiraceae bacterium]